MNIISIIEKKINKQALTEEEINYFINGFCNGDIKDYQASSLLMSIRINGMNEDETYYLTKAMLESGKTLDLSKINGITVDKHSTGGVGDKTSLVLVPLLASLGFKVAKMSGKGLGHTGGTIDKLQSISGFKTEINLGDFFNQVNTIGCSIISQSDELVYADKLLYALRDVTGTVKSLPLIVSSIMSKKIALGTDIICLDVKAGNGAFFESVDDAIEAAELMIKIGKRFNVKVKAIVTSMDEPLGNNIGNSLEVKEAIDTLLGKGPKDLENICIEIAKLFIQETNMYENISDLYSFIKAKIDSKEAYNKLVEMISYQHGSLPLKEEELIVTDIVSAKEGYISNIDTKKLGNLLTDLGGGRKTKEDSINYNVGYTIYQKINCKVKKGDLLFKVYSTSPLTNNLINDFLNTLVVTDNPNPNFKEIYAIL